MTPTRDRLTEALKFLRSEAAPLVAFAIGAAALAAFLHLANETVIEGETRDFDLRVLTALRLPGQPHVPIGPGWLLEAVRDLSALGSVAVLTLIALVVTGFALVRRRYAAAAATVVALGGGMLACQLLKTYFERARPPEIYREVEVIKTSFPSGHAMLSAVMFLTLAALLARTLPSPVQKAYAVGVAVLVTVVVGLSRIFLGVHWTTDVLAGWSIGAAWASACWLATLLLDRFMDRRTGDPGKPHLDADGKQPPARGKSQPRPKAKRAPTKTA
jgi:undecaprenyl-diphosphatase